MLNYIQKASLFATKTAISENKKSYSFNQLLNTSGLIATHLLNERTDLNQERVAFMVKPGFDYVAVQWGIWRAGGVIVPLCISYPLNALEYVIEDTGASIIVIGEEYLELLKPFAKSKGITLHVTTDIKREKSDTTLPVIDSDRMAMILYTSGTTNLPKGVVSTFENLDAQIGSLLEAWEWTKDDHALCLLPLHHVHGIVNVVCCSMAAGACCEFLDKFTPEVVFGILNKKQVNVFMAVPTIYYKLISYWDTLSTPKQQEITLSLNSFRLMISGSAALPVSVMERWKQISGHTLLERYGMTEIGMAISNPYHGKRLAGHVGIALPGVNVRLADEQNVLVVDEPGEIQIKGKNVFLEYWQRPEETRKSFTPDGWFKTGDIALLDNGYYRILGRNSTDIIKSGGYKISALEIEELLRTYPGIDDCAVIGIENEEWGEVVVAAIVKINDIDTSTLDVWMRAQIPSYKTPKKYIYMKELPRNAMGKVTKNELKKLFS